MNTDMAKNINQVQEELYPSWNNCPTDILLKLFDIMPMPILAVGMFVNRTWRSHVEYVLEVKNKWKEFVNTVTNYSGQLKSKAIACGWRQIFHNYILWYNVEKANINHQQVIEINNIKHLRIYRGSLIVVTHSNVLYYDVKTLTKQKTVEVTCRDFCENDDMIIVVTEDEKFLKLQFYKKPALDLFDMNQNDLHTVDNVICYKFHDNRCYYLDDPNSLYKCTIFKGSLKIFFIARFYGSPRPKLTMSINVFDDQLYLLYKDGTMLWVDPERRNLRTMTYIREPPKKSEIVDRKMFHWYCLVIDDECLRLAPEDTHVRYRNQLHIDSYSRLNSYNESVVFVYNLTNVSCMLQHGDVLFLGYSDGTVEIISPRDGLSKDPLRRFNLKHLQEGITDLQVVSIEIYEEDSQYLFVATSTHVFHLCFTHDNCENYMWTDKICIKSILPRIDHCIR